MTGAGSQPRYARPVPTIGDTSSAAQRRVDPSGWAMGEAVTEELHALFMPDASFHVGLTPVAGDGLGPYGAEDVTLALRPHAGVEPRPLGRGASGGELSRVMLALEVVLAATDPVPTFVFDEVDAGVVESDRAGRPPSHLSSLRWEVVGRVFHVAAQRHVRPPVVLGGVSIHRGDDLAVDDVDTDVSVASVVSVDELL